jgi:signal transduction histidine kinase
MPHPIRWAALCVAIAAQPISGVAQGRLARRITSSGEILLGGIRSLAQDSVGFIWLGTNGGLLRWDGVELRRWAPGELRSWINYMSVCPDGTLHVVAEGSTLFAITPAGAQAVPGPGGPPFSQLRNARCDRDGTLWVTAESHVWRRDRAGAWQDVAPATFAAEAPFIIEGPDDGGVFVRTARTLWRVTSAGAARVLDAPAPQALALTPAGDTVLLTRGQGLFRVEHNPWRLTPLVGPIGRGIDMQRRGTTVWVSFDRFLIALRPGEPPDVIGSDVLPEGGGLMVVDREGSLWIGTFSGLVQFPEPEAVYWNDQHGLPSAHTRYLARTENRVWASTWQGLGYIEERGGRRTAHVAPQDWRSAMPLHVDPRGALWVASNGGLRQVVDGRSVRTTPSNPFVWDIVDAPDGGVWTASADGWQHAPAGGGALRPVDGTPFPPGSNVRQMLRTRDGHLWLAGDERICGTTGPASTPLGASWACDSIPGAVEITDLIEVPSGALWASSSRLGVWRRREGRWEVHPGTATLTSPSVYRLRPARGEGVWVLGASVPRVREALDSPLGWDVLETITAWQGVTSLGGDVLEDADSTLWLATSLGVARVPASARHTTPAAPPVVLVEVAVDGAPVGLEGPRLRHRHNRLDVRFAALSYRDAPRVRYQVRLAPREDWTDHAGLPALRWIDLPAGHYRAEVRASLDGRAWSAQPAAVAITVQAPWFLNAKFLALAAIAVLAAAFAAHRARLAVALRLERQRSQIALDLHDEMGSGLGSIGILSGVLGDERLEAAERRRIAGEIGAVAGELGASLSDIVWSLRPVAGTLGDVAARLADHGARLFANGPTRFATRFPDAWPSTLLDAAISRGILLIGLEALYNAARHAAAGHVTLACAMEPGGWSIEVADDGRGLRPDVDNGGLGLRSMRRRAEAIGGRIEWTVAPGGGTRVALHMVMRGRG